MLTATKCACKVTRTIRDNCIFFEDSKQKIFNQGNCEPKQVSPDENKLREYLSENYNKLSRAFRGWNYYVIDKLSMSPFDKFSEGILECLDDNADFTFKNDEMTMQYVNKKICKASHRYQMADYREPLKLQLFEEYEPDWD